jgi:hypothetical protein
MCGCWTAADSRVYLRPMSPHDIHQSHEHEHQSGCGHVAVRHEGHVDYLHDGHLHHPHDDHYDEHTVAVGGANPAEHTDPAPGHNGAHSHGPGCGHEAVPHGDHNDFLVDRRLHHPHGDHCDDHGPLEVA